MLLFYSLKNKKVTMLLVTNAVLSPESDTVICHNCHFSKICLQLWHINYSPMIVHILTVTTVTVTLLIKNKSFSLHVSVIFRTFAGKA
jgi:hypothetical protein